MSKCNLKHKCKPSPKFGSTCIIFQMVVRPGRSLKSLLSYICVKLLNCVSADTALRKLELVSMPSYLDELAAVLYRLNWIGIKYCCSDVEALIHQHV